MKKNVWLFFTLVLVVLASRFIPHPPNFTPIIALGLFIGAYSKNYVMWGLPLIGILLSDFVLGFYHPLSMVTVYLGILLSFVMGQRFLSLRVKSFRVLASAIGSSVLFFIVSNLGVWMTAQWYPMNLNGLYECYVAAIPFFHNTLVSTVLYTAALFLVYEVQKDNENTISPIKASV